MKREFKLFVYFLLLSVFTFGVIVQKNNEDSKAYEANVVNTDQQQSQPTVITAKVKAKETDSVLSAQTQKVVVTNRGDELSVLINKNVRLPETYEPEDLVSFGSKIPGSNKRLLLRKQAFNFLEKMAKAAEKTDIHLIVTSAYRSYWSQQATFQHWVSVAGADSAETFAARPGHSQHQLGTTVDFGTGGEAGFPGILKNSKEANWLETNSYKYGFVLGYPEGEENVTGYTFEPWHYRFIGVENANHMKDSGLILEEYLREFGIW